MILKQPYPPATRGTVIVWGLLATLPVGGLVWQVFHYLVPLRRLGFDVWYIEDSDRPLYDMTTFEPTQEPPRGNIGRVARFMSEVGLGHRWAFRKPLTETVVGGLDWPGLERLYKDAVAAVNLCGAQEIGPRQLAVRNRIYLQTDPVGTQVKVAQGDAGTIEMLDRHDWHFTYGVKLGQPDCLIPYIGRYPWQPTVPPVCLDFWDCGPPPRGAKLSTVLNWKHDDRNVTWNGQTWHWSKDREFRRFIEAPSRSPLPLELCLGGASEADIAELGRHGWGIKPSTDYLEPDAYHDFIVGSLGEFSAAKELVVVTRSGWISDRTVCYLAAGRPAIVQDTGVDGFMKLGEGLLSFSTLDEALAAIGEVAGDYERHSAAARRLAREHFDGERVLADILRKVGVLEPAAVS